MEPVPAKPRQQNDGDFRWHQRFSTRVAIGAGASVGLAVLAAMLASGIAMQRSLLRSEREHVRSTAILFAAGVQAAVASGEKDALLRQKEALIFSASGLEFLAISNGKGEVIAEWERTANSTTAERLLVEEVPLTGAARAGSLGSVRLGFSSDRVQRVLRQLWGAMIAATFFATVIAILGTVFVSRHIGKSVQDVARAARNIASLDWKGRQPNSSQDEVALLATSFQAMEEALAELAEKARAVAAGNLGVDIEAEGDIADSFRTMVENLRGTVRQMAEAAAQVAGASAQIQFASEEQEVAAQQQSASVEQVRRTIDSLLEAAAHISESAQGVLSNAERTRATTGLIAGKVAELGRHTSRITEILDIIREIADRSDLLALNASIEATRAGEAGRSFALVAAEMRRLAERVTASVQDVKTLVDDIRSFGASTVMATEEGRKLAESTTESARQITMVTQQQRSGTQQVTESMKDIAGILAQSVTASQQTRALAETLNTQATLLADVVGRFRLSGYGNGNGNGSVVQGNVVPEERREKSSASG